MSEQVNMAAHYEHEIPEGYEAKIEGNKVIIELKESEDEKIRKFLIEKFSKLGEIWSEYSTKTILAWFKKQKPVKTVSRDEYVKRFKTLCEGYEINLPNREYDIYHLCDDLSKLSMDSGKQQPNIEICPHSNKSKSYKENGYPIEQKPAEKQDYSGLNDFERAILRGFLCAGIDNVPVTIIKETVQDCLSQMKPAEWSEEDEKCIKDIIICLEYLQREDAERKWNGDRNVKPERYDGMIAKLKSLRPQPKQGWNNASEITPPDNCDLLGWYKHNGQLEAKPKLVWFSSKEEAQHEVEGYAGHLIAYWIELPEDGLYEKEPEEPHWKPSEEQICELNWASKLSPVLESLYNDLKKLM